MEFESIISRAIFDRMALISFAAYAHSIGVRASSPVVDAMVDTLISALKTELSKDIESSLNVDANFDSAAENVKPKFVSALNFFLQKLEESEDKT